MLKTSLSLCSSVRDFDERRAVSEIRSYLTKHPRIKVLRGLRGVGKTTIMLQILDKADGVYFSSDWPSIKSAGIYESGKRLIEAGYLNLFIDEVHQYPDWQNEIKALHDQYPECHLFCSGSAAVAFIPDRRQKLFDIPPLGFSEFLRLSEGIDVNSETELWLDESKSISLVSKYYPAIEEQFRRYLSFGAFPISNAMDESDALDAIYNSVNKSIKEDSISFLKLSRAKVFAMEKLLIMLATSPPGELSVTSLSGSLDASKTTMYELIDGLIRMDILRRVNPDAKGSRLVRGEPKLLFTHPNIRMAICHVLGKIYPKGSVREEIALFSLLQRGWSINTIKGRKTSPDYQVSLGKKKYVLEIGGSSKDRSQLKGFDHALIVRDDQLKVLSLF